MDKKKECIILDNYGENRTFIFSGDNRYHTL